MSDEYPIFGFRDGEFSTYGYCRVWGHDYWRISDSPNGICLVCGNVAQGMLDKVKRIVIHKQLAEEWNLEERICAICGKRIEWTRWFYSKITFDGNHVCGTRHKYQYEINWILSVKPNNGGTDEALPFKWSWSQVMPIILDRDNHACQQCGAMEEKVKCQPHELNYDWERSNLEVHHIQFRSQGGSDHPANLITLCHDCHTNITREKFAKDRIEKKYENIAKLEDFAG